MAASIEEAECDEVVGGAEAVGDAGETLVNRFLDHLDISYLHVFTYSERDNTHALTLKPVVPIRTRNERNKILRNISYIKMQAFTEKHIGQTRKVLFEHVNKNGMMEGYTDNYIKITAAYKKGWENKVVEWVV